MTTADTLINTLERADHQAHVIRAPRGQWLLPLVRILTALAVLLARHLERANR
jgi:hypothetical protein